MVGTASKTMTIIAVTIRIREKDKISMEMIEEIQGLMLTDERNHSYPMEEEIAKIVSGMLQDIRLLN